VTARDEDRARALYAERDADAEWAARWSADNPVARFAAEGRLRGLRALLPDLTARFGPPSGWRVLEAGVGSGGLLPWLRDEAGVPEDRLAGIDLSGDRILAAARALPRADVRPGSAAELPWPSASFEIVVASTLFSSVLDPDLRSRIAGECLRVLAPGGVVLWYDMRDDFLLAGVFRRLAKPAEDWLGRGEIARLFPGCTLRLRRATLFLPLARPLLSVSPALARAAEAVKPFLRGHYLGLVIKPGGDVG
jgi:SAM-dependent methyltransferase